MVTGLSLLGLTSLTQANKSESEKNTHTQIRKKKTKQNKDKIW